MKQIFSTLAALLALGGVASANDTMDAMTGATVTYTYGDGTSVTAYYSEDGAYTTDVAGGGTWSIDGDQLCIETDGGDTGCTMLDSGYGPGDSWGGVDAFGNPVTISID